MATNPMQRKARNSFLLGMLVMVLISGVVIAFLFIQLMNKNKKEQEELKASVKAYVLNKDVSSGQVITTDMLSLQTVNKNLVPSNATSDITMIQNYALQDKEGNDIYTKYDKNNNPKLYINKNNKEYEVQKEDETDNYYIIDYKIEIDKLEEVIRDHWNIECGLHWRLDVILDEDHSRNRVGNSINNLAIIRKIVFNLASLDTSFGTKKMPLQRKLTRYMLDFKNIEMLIFEVIPSIS